MATKNTERKVRGEMDILLRFLPLTGLVWEFLDIAHLVQRSGSKESRIALADAMEQGLVMAAVRCSNEILTSSLELYSSASPPARNETRS